MCRLSSSPLILITWFVLLSESKLLILIDASQQVTDGMEGFFNRPATANWVYEYDGASGQDYDAIMALSSIDFGTIHLYVGHKYVARTRSPDTVLSLTDNGHPAPDIKICLGHCSSSRIMTIAASQPISLRFLRKPQSAAVIRLTTVKMCGISGNLTSCHLKVSMAA